MPLYLWTKGRKKMDHIQKMNERLIEIRKNKEKILADFVDAYLATLDPIPENVKQFIESVDLFCVESPEGGLLLQEALKDTDICLTEYPYRTRVSRFIIKARKTDLTYADLFEESIKLKRTNYYKNALKLLLRYINDPILTAQFKL